MTIADLNSILASFALITGVGLALAQQILARLTTRRISKRVGARSDQGLGESVADADTPPPLVPEYHKARAEVVISAGLLLLWRADIPFKAQLPVLSIQVSESTIPPLVAIVLSYGVCRLVMDAIGVPAPHVMAWATILTEVIGGLAVILGAFVALLALPMAALLVVATFTIHLPYGFSSIKLLSVTAAGAQFGPPGYESNLLYLACLAALVLGGSGPLAIDGLVRKRRAAGDYSRASSRGVA